MFRKFILEHFRTHLDQNGVANKNTNWQNSQDVAVRNVAVAPTGNDAMSQCRSVRQLGMMQ